MNSSWLERAPDHTGPLLIDLMDPHCGWCFGFHGTMASFSPLHGNSGSDAALRVVPGGLFVPGRQSSAANADVKRPIARRVEDTFGWAFSEDYFLNVLGADWLDSGPPGRAIIAAELLDANPLDYSGYLMDAAFRNGRDISDEQVMINLASEYGLERTRFADALRSELAHQRMQIAGRFAAQVQSGFPSVFLQVAPGEPLRRLGGGELSADAIRDALGQVLQSTPAPIS